MEAALRLGKTQWLFSMYISHTLSPVRKRNKVWRQEDLPIGRVFCKRAESSWETRIYNKNNSRTKSFTACWRGATQRDVDSPELWQNPLTCCRWACNTAVHVVCLCWVCWLALWVTSLHPVHSKHYEARWCKQNVATRTKGHYYDDCTHIASWLRRGAQAFVPRGGAFL